jgi:hypothetical protein
MWMFRGSRSWSQWGVVRRFHVLLACRKFWFCYVVRPLLPGPSSHFFVTVVVTIVAAKWKGRQSPLTQELLEQDEQ